MPPTDRRANYALGILTLINLFNYIDRWVVAAVIEPIKHALGLSDTQLGIIGTGFIIVYAMTSPIFGTLGDRRELRASTGCINRRCRPPG